MPARRPLTELVRAALPVALSAALALSCLAAAPSPSPAAPGWVAAWAAPMAVGGSRANDLTVRQVAPVTAAGSQVRVQLSNQFGTAPLTITAASVALQTTGAGIAAATLQPLRFAGQPSVTIPAGALATSDPAPLAVRDGQSVEVSVYVAGAATFSVHPCCTSAPASYLGADGSGNLTATATGKAFGRLAHSSRWVDAVNVLATDRGSVAALGDGITDGFRSTLRWTRVLAERLARLPESEQVAVLDDGIAGNTAGPVAGLPANFVGGPPGVSRLAADVLDQPGVRAVIVELGGDDLRFGATAGQVIAALTRIAAAAGVAHLKAIAVTLLPEAGSRGWTSKDQAALVAVNQWLRDSSTFPVVLDWARLAADVYDGACFPQLLAPAFDAGDHVDLNALGQAALANSLPTTLLGAGPAPAVKLRLPPRTPGCDPGPVVITHSAAVAQPSRRPVLRLVIRRSDLNAFENSPLDWAAATLSLLLILGLLSLTVRRRRRRAR